MRSGRWSFNRHLYFKHVKRLWPLWGAYSLFLFMIMPVYLLLESQRTYTDKNLYIAVQQHLTTMTTEMALSVSFCFGLAIAMAIWAYLYQQRSVSMFHALPLSREGLFLTNFLTGISFFLVPNFVVFLLSLGVQAIIGAMAVESLVIWFLCQTLLCFFFYAFATCLAFVTGHLIVLPCLFVIFNFLAKTVATLLNWTFTEFMFGYTMDSIGWLNWLGKWLSPPSAIFQELTYAYPTDYYYSNLSSDQYLMELSGVGAVVAYAIVALFLVALAYLFYRRRKLERCGEVVAIGFLRPVFTYGAAICGGLAFGNICYQTFQGLLPRGMVTMLCLLLLFCAVFYFAAEMLQRKSFRVFRKTGKGYLVLAAVMIVTMVAMDWDISGYERTVPQLDQVERVRWISYGGHNEGFEDPAYIAAVLNLHQSVISEKNEMARRIKGKDAAFNAMLDYVQQEDGVYVQEANWAFMYLEYTMKDGSILRREYQIPVTREDMNRENSAVSQFYAIVNKPEWVFKSLIPSTLQTEDLTTATIYRMTLADVSGPYGSYMHDTDTITGEDCNRLYEAFLEDVMAGCAGQRTTFYNEDYMKNNYTNYIYFTFWGEYSHLYDNEDYLWFTQTDHYGRKRVSYEVGFSPTRECSAVLAVLEDLGYTEESGLVTLYELDRHH